MFDFTKQLVSRRSVARQAPKNIAPVKPSLTTAKQKEAEINRLIDKSYLPSGMRLAKIRQLAAQGKVLPPKEARDFLHRSEAGKKLEGKELLKYEKELLEAEVEATQDAVHSPIKYKFRGDEHFEEKAKLLYKQLRQEGIDKAREESAVGAKLTAMQERQERLKTITNVLHPQSPAPGTSTAPAVSHLGGATPMQPMQAVEPLATVHPSGSPLVAPPSGVGSHIPGTYGPITDPTIVGLPTLHREPQSTTPVPSAPLAEPLVPPIPVLHEPLPSDQPLPPLPKVPTESMPTENTLVGAGTPE